MSCLPRPLGQWLAVVLIAAAVPYPSALAADTPPELAALRAARPAMVRSLVAASERCIERTDT
ncbi:MAG TPA: hypothetical protein VGL28_01655 [Steroidobacteraceae bacterium]